MEQKRQIDEYRRQIERNMSHNRVANLRAEARTKGIRRKGGF